jgi:hypothetical protein
MAKHAYMSHWDLAGDGPDVRYGLAGGTDLVMENVYSSWQGYDNGTPVPITDWRAEIQRAETALMNSPGHRANIMAPEHTQVGIGIAYNSQTGEFRIAQEFVNHYIQLNPLPQSAQPGETLTVQGQLLSGSTSPVINLAYEPAPQPMTVEMLNQTHTYSSPAQLVEADPVQEKPGSQFTAQVHLGNQTGLYHIRIWVTVSSKMVQAVDALVWVGVQP